jgi:hypothetical protein
MFQTAKTAPPGGTKKAIKDTLNGDQGGRVSSLAVRCCSTIVSLVYRINCEALENAGLEKLVGCLHTCSPGAGLLHS